MERLLLSIEECEKRSLVPGKLTVIIETFNSPIERLMTTLFSILLRAGPIPNPLEHIIVYINGPDSRTGSTEIQDKKEEFLAELLKLQWVTPHGGDSRDMPLTINRIWSRVGHGQAIDAALPWVHTEAYLIVGDDQIILNENWINDLKNNFLDKPNVVIANGDSDVPIGYTENPQNQKWQLLLPRFCNYFFACKKWFSEAKKIRWSSYFINHDFNLRDKPETIQYFTSRPELKRFQGETKHLEALNFGQVVMESGAWAKYKAEGANRYFPGIHTQQNQDLSWHDHKSIIEKLEREIFKIPEYWELYNKYLPAKHEFTLDKYDVKDINPNMKVLVCVCVYNRARTIANWLRAWQNCEKYGAKICVVHSMWDQVTHKRQPKFTLQDQVNIIEGLKPDYYIQRANVGQDIGALHEMVTEPRVKPWDAIVWFTDDCLPMRKDFLKPFMVELSNPECGLFGPFPESGYVRTVSFGIKHDVLTKIPWINGGKIEGRQHCLQFENQMASQVEATGYKISYLYGSKDSANYVHWSKYSDWLWDADGLGNLDLWDKFEQQFPPEKRNPTSLRHLDLLERT